MEGSKKFTEFKKFMKKMENYITHFLSEEFKSKVEEIIGESNYKNTTLELLIMETSLFSSRLDQIMPPASILYNGREIFAAYIIMEKDYHCALKYLKQDGLITKDKFGEIKNIIIQCMKKLVHRELKLQLNIKMEEDEEKQEPCQNDQEIAEDLQKDHLHEDETGGKGEEEKKTCQEEKWGINQESSSELNIENTELTHREENPDRVSQDDNNTLNVNNQGYNEDQKISGNPDNKNEVNEIEEVNTQKINEISIQSNTNFNAETSDSENSEIIKKKKEYFSMGEVITQKLDGMREMFLKEVDITNDIKLLKKKNTSLEADISILKADNSWLKDKNTSLEADISWLKDKNTSLEADISILKADNSWLKDKNTSLEADISWLKDKNTSLEADNSSTKDDLKKLNTKYTVLNQTYKSIITAQIIREVVSFYIRVMEAIVGRSDKECVTVENFLNYGNNYNKTFSDDRDSLFYFQKLLDLKNKSNSLIHSIFDESSVNEDEVNLEKFYEILKIKLPHLPALEEFIKKELVPLNGKEKKVILINGPYPSTIKEVIEYFK